jgi:hypothetical protein
MKEDSNGTAASQGIPFGSFAALGAPYSLNY